MRWNFVPAVCVAAVAMTLATGCATGGGVDWDGIGKAVADRERARLAAQDAAPRDEWPCPYPGFNKTYPPDEGGNVYTGTCAGDEIRWSGYNPRTGSAWTNYYKRNGDRYGFDRLSRRWSCTAATGDYWRSDGATGYRDCRRERGE